MNIVILGLSITSSWGNGHATTYRSLVRGLTERGHRVLFLERDVPWYAGNRDLPDPPYGRTQLYSSLSELKRRFESEVREADLAVVGSYVPEGVEVGEWVTSTAQGVTAFYDIDTPITLRKLEAADTEYLAPFLVPRYNLYLSFTGGPVLQRIERVHGSPAARPLYCSVDPLLYHPEHAETLWDLGYLGTYSVDRQAKLDALLVAAAQDWPEGRFVVAGPQYPSDLSWPSNVTRIEHLPPAEHRRFYNSQRYSLNITRSDMVMAGYSPSVRLFEAAACGTPIISDCWAGLEEFFVPGDDILLAERVEQVLGYLQKGQESQRQGVAQKARKRVLGEHTGSHRAVELEAYVAEVQRSALGQ